MAAGGCSGAAGEGAGEGGPPSPRRAWLTGLGPRYGPPPPPILGPAGRGGEGGARRGRWCGDGALLVVGLRPACDVLSAHRLPKMVELVGRLFLIVLAGKQRNAVRQRIPPCFGTWGEDVEKVWGPGLHEFREWWVRSWREKSRQIFNKLSSGAVAVS